MGQADGAVKLCLLRQDPPVLNYGCPVPTYKVWFIYGRKRYFMFIWIIHINIKCRLIDYVTSSPIFFMDHLLVLVRLMPSLHHPTRRGGSVLYRSAYAILVTQLESESACVCGRRTCHRGGRPFRPMCLQIFWACPDFELSVGDTVWSSKIQVNSHCRHRRDETVLSRQIRRCALLR